MGFALLVAAETMTLPIYIAAPSPALGRTYTVVLPPTGILLIVAPDVMENKLAL
jgi:hypothetical protein